ncbi:MULTISPECIES: AbrB/MazE/SpoVT family DNA-binding domain-containing protein [Metallosphaera]|uniref:AbrB/MazE/SpoVT family DNA-binding domain-containing protein n=1 Tax=Metallosphaera TaxID=41980 RepID=UPI001F06BAA5|nr:AbrB/MazE/SpoVT family DNA-binding domain-containing protein [Metallosphaera sedula]MCH1770456.1 AbrB/MazE/SpoVT family DNA-binding domain-containing protein [Metallosphaera sedula]
MVKVTKKYQVTIPKEVRERIGLEPFEEVEVVALNQDEILVRRKPRTVRDPLPILFGSRNDMEVPPEKVDEFAEE